MALPLIPTTAVLVVLLVLIYQYIIFPAVVSPLAKVPNAHWSAPFSPLWILFHRQRQNDTPTVHAAHTRLGPLIRLAPNEISVNCVEGGIRTIYAGGYEKGNWYSNVFSNYGVEPMFAMEHHGDHSRRKRMLSNIYAKTTLQKNPAVDAITKVLISDRLIPSLSHVAEAGPVELYDVLSSVVMDFVSAYVFGLKNGSDFIRQPTAAAAFFRDYKARQRYMFWPQELPRLMDWAFKLGVGNLLIPSWVTSSNNSIEDWLMAMCNKAEETILSSSSTSVSPEDYPTVYSQLRTSLISSSSSSPSSKSPLPFSQSENKTHLASELLDHVLAGFDTSGITLTWLAWELSKPQNHVWQHRLRSELHNLGPENLLDAKTLDSRCPVLHAILMESLRLHAAIPGNQPRVTPANAVLGDLSSEKEEGGGLCVREIPAGVRVQAQAWSLHRNPVVFPEPEKWNPERWISGSEENKREMGRWFWAFGSGGRMCVGSNLAMLDMKAVVAGIWGNFETEIVDGEGMVHNGGYLAEPVGVGPEEGRRFCVLRLRRVEEG